MKQELLKLKRLRDKVIGIEMQLSLTDTDLLAVERDIEYLESLLAVLNENVEILKSDGIVAVASEYKKIKEELKVVADNLYVYTNLHQKLLKEFDRYKILHQETFKEYEDLKKEIEASQAVLDFDKAKRKK
jgi:ubiquinone/menaquinone biosynthesis C-methylase UbiE